MTKSLNRAGRADAIEIHANQVLAYAILHSREVPLPTRLLGVYLASWYSPSGVGTDSVTVHPEDDRARLSLAMSAEQFEDARLGLDAAGMWRNVDTAASRSGHGYHLVADLSALVAPRSWRHDLHAWDPMRRVGMKHLARYSALTAETRMTALVIATALSASERVGKDMVTYPRTALQALLPGIPYWDHLEALEREGILLLHYRRDDVQAAWTTEYAHELRAYKGVWWEPRVDAADADPETAYERRWRERHGLTLDPRDYDPYNPETDVALPWRVYVLVDPRTDQARYVGITRDPQRRLRQHVEREATGLGDAGWRSPGSHDHNLGMRRWIADLHAQGLEPLMEVLPGEIYGTREEAEKYESFAILAAHRAGDLLNLDVVRQYDRSCR